MPAAAHALQASHRTLSTVAEFQTEFGGLHNYLLDGECVPFAFNFPAIDVLVDVLRRDEDVRIMRGGRDGIMDSTDIRAEFRAMPIEKALESRFALSHFKLANFEGKGKILDGFEERVMQPWRDFLSRAGFTWERCYPIFFLSGPHAGSSYHMDVSHVLAWQLYGTKIFSGLKDPERFSPIEEAVKKSYRDALAKPELRPDEVLAYTMNPGAVLWNQLLTPHWVNAGDDQVAASLNISHGMIRYKRNLSPNEQRLDEWWNQHPDEAWRTKTK